jgi:DNA-binding transcriptional MerR regulator
VSDTFHIGALARATGRSVHAIRWYEEQGLMPGVVRDGGGRRVYRGEHVEWLSFLDRLRFTGMTVKDLQAYAALVSQGRESLGARQDLLRTHRENTLERIAELERAVKLIDLKIDFYDEWRRTKRRPAHMPSLDDVEDVAG